MIARLKERMNRKRVYGKYGFTMHMVVLNATLQSAIMPRGAGHIISVTCGHKLTKIELAAPARRLDLACPSFACISGGVTLLWSEGEVYDMVCMPANSQTESYMSQVCT